MLGSHSNLEYKVVEIAVCWKLPDSDCVLQSESESTHVSTGGIPDRLVSEGI
jgi:hypothetical protein